MIINGDSDLCRFQPSQNPRTSQEDGKWNFREILTMEVGNPHDTLAHAVKPCIQNLGGERMVKQQLATTCVSSVRLLFDSYCNI
jgi:hypothetical protein